MYMRVQCSMFFVHHLRTPKRRPYLSPGASSASARLPLGVDRPWAIKAIPDQMHVKTEETCKVPKSTEMKGIKILHYGRKVRSD